MPNNTGYEVAYFHKFLQLFNFEDQLVAEKFLTQKPLNFFGFAFGSVRVPLLFWDGKEIRDQFESILFLTSAVKEDNQVFDLIKYDFIDEMSIFLNKNSISRMFVIANWENNSYEQGKIVRAGTGRLREIYRLSIDTDIYFCGENLEWILAFNHFRLGFFAGQKKLVEGFADYYPSYRKFIPDSNQCCDAWIAKK